MYLSNLLIEATYSKHTHKNRIAIFFIRNDAKINKTTTQSVKNAARLIKQQSTYYYVIRRILKRSGVILARPPSEITLVSQQSAEIRDP